MTKFVLYMHQLSNMGWIGLKGYVQDCSSALSSVSNILNINTFLHCMQLKALDILGKEPSAIVHLGAVTSCGWLRFPAVN